MIHFIPDCIYCHNDWEVAISIGADDGVGEKNVIIVTGAADSIGPVAAKKICSMPPAS